MSLKTRKIRSCIKNICSQYYKSFISKVQRDVWNLSAFFHERLQFSIQAEIEILNQENKDYNDLIRKTTSAKAKAWRRIAFQVKKVDPNCLGDHYCHLDANKSHKVNLQSQEHMKDSRQQESKTLSSSSQQRTKVYWGKEKKHRREKKL